MINFYSKPIFGMIHLSGLTDKEKIAIALEEIDILYNEGVDGCIIENYHGSINNVIDTLEAIDYAKYSTFKFGVNILPNEYDISLGLTKDYKLDFIQLDYVAGKYKCNPVCEIDEEVFTYALNKFNNVNVLGGVWPKYYSPVKGSVLEDDIEQACKRSHAIVVTGSGTGQETPLDKIKQFKQIIDGRKPLIIGAGLNIGNIEQLEYADGAIVGSCFKEFNNTFNKINPVLVKNFMMSKLKGIA